VKGLLVGLLPVLAACGLLSSCGLFTTCPVSVDAPLSRGIPGETEATLIAVGRVIRYVPSPTLSYRGYDVSLRRIFAGDPVESILFLRAPDQIPGIRRLSPVLVVAEIDGTEPQLLTAGRCQPLQGISEAEFIRWTGGP
jgi:hypothetical protein